jgi:GDPmannose 4,6-dehydratase
MWLILQQDNPDDFCIGTGKSHTVEEFLKAAFFYVNLDWKDYVEIDPRYYRPVDPQELRADINRAKQRLSWQPRITFEELVKIMVDYDMETLGLTSPGEGKRILKEKGFSWVKDDIRIKMMSVER